MPSKNPNLRPRKKKPVNRRKSTYLIVRVTPKFREVLHDWTDMTGEDYSKLVRRLLLEFVQSEQYKETAKPIKNIDKYYLGMF